ncbi:hypothetical protein LADH09A_000880, partial [Micromonospora sp. LAH09]|uniref:hypothetical protein n=1 Tax=Micromonospora cabrerizensis TaxID=2911213 RepID=UPI001EE838D6
KKASASMGPRSAVSSMAGGTVSDMVPAHQLTITVVINGVDGADHVIGETSTNHGRAARRSRAKKPREEAARRSRAKKPREEAARRSRADSRAEKP